MSLWREEYDSILARERTGTLTLYIDKASFRQLFMSSKRRQFESLIGQSLAVQAGVISFLMYCELPLAGAAALTSVAAFGWWSLLVVPGHLATWLVLATRSSVGHARLGVQAFLLIAGVGGAVALPQAGVWSRVFFVRAPMSWGAKPLMYHWVARFAFDLILRNYEAFMLLYYRPRHLGFPFAWTHPDDERFAPAADAEIARQMDRVLGTGEAKRQTSSAAPYGDNQ